MSWKAEYGLLLLLSTSIQYYCGLQIEKHRLNSATSKRFMWLGVLSDLSMLFFFKYFDFFGENSISLANLLGFELSWTTLNILLPVGISFYVFQTMSYTIDVYRGTMKAEKDFTLFALYVSFFPQLVAGPIERASNLLPQFHSEREVNSDKVISGLQIMAQGFFKKMVVADNLAVFVDKVYDPNYHGTGIEYVLATYAFMFQVYCDFSGYSDIAVGTARIMGFDLMKNFNQPFFATSIVEFWQRWHISLSSWVRDYIYIPLGGNRKGNFRTYVNLFLTMFIIGVWHGAKWTVVIYAIINGLSVAISRFIQKAGFTFRPFFSLSPLNKAFNMFLVLNIICLPHIYFRSQYVSQANNILLKIFQDIIHPFNISVPDSLPVIGSVFLLVVLLRDFMLEYYPEKINEKNPALVTSTYYTFIIITILIFGIFKASQFIYFQF